MQTLAIMAKENKSEGSCSGPPARASGLRHMTLPIRRPINALPGGTLNESSKSRGLTSMDYEL